MAKKTTTTTTTKNKTTAASKKASAPAKPAAAKKSAATAKKSAATAKKSSKSARKSSKAAKGAVMGKIAVIAAIAACAVAVVFFFFKFFDVSLAGNSAASVNGMQAAPGGGDSGDTIAQAPTPSSGGPTNWTAVADTTFDTQIYAIAYGGNRFVAGNYGGKMAYSDDGRSWTAVADSAFPATYTRNSNTFRYSINAITGGNNRWVAVGYQGKIAYSSNGQSWTAVADSTFGTNDLYNGINAVAWGTAGNAGGRFVAVGESGKIAYCDW